MNILAFDTSGPLLAVALRTDAGTLFDIRDVGMHHGELLAPRLEYLLSQASLEPGDLGLIVCARGPGSFTGLRIGMATAKGLSAGTGTPLVSVPVPDFLARPLALLENPVLVLIDAKKGRFYGALYRRGKRLSEYFDLDAASIAALVPGESDLLFTGPDAALAISRLSEDDRARVRLLPTGAAVVRDLLLLGEEQFQASGPDDPGQGPLYIRRSEAEIMRDVPHG